MTPEKPGLFEELKRRHVWRATVAYAVVGWLVVQVATQVFPFFNIPNTDVRLVVVLVLFGFPIVLALAWVYEITPEGVRRTVPADAPEARPQDEARQIGRKLNVVTTALLVLAVALLGWRLLAERHGNDDASGRGVAATSAIAARADSPAGSAVASASPPLRHATPTAFNPPADTLVVLPFTNLNGDPKQQYFSDGITEELTNALGQNSALRVIAWDTASKYRDSGESPHAVGAALDVASLLHGSIERENGMVRVIAELVDTRTGQQLWSDHYDDSLANVFQVQDRISKAIAGALKVKLASLTPAPTVNPEAHDLVLRAHALIDTAATAAPIKQARGMLEQAIAIDPGYAEAHAALARAWLDLTQVSTLTLKDALPKVRMEAGKALAPDSRNVAALVVLGNADAAEGRIAAAKAEYQHALALDPSDAIAHVDYGNVLPLEQAQAQALEAVQLDPRNAIAQNNLATYYLDLGEYAQALPPWLVVMKLAPHSVDSAMALALTYSLLHRDADAVKAFERAQPDTPLAKALVEAGRLTYQSVLAPKLHTQALASVDVLRHHAKLDPTSLADVLQLYLALGRNDTAMELLPKFCASISAGCNDLSLNPVWLPLRGEPAFQALVKKYDTMAQAPASAPSSP